jgi:hypothetical protein
VGAGARAGLILLLLLSAPLAAQEAEPKPEPAPETSEEAADEAEDMRLRLDRLENELANLRSRLETRERDAVDEELRDQTLVQVYGGIGLRYHMLFEGQTETFNRPEFRLHLGVFGTAFNQDDQRLRYDLRMTTASTDMAGLPTPTLSWLPFPGFGANVGVAFDRFLIDYELDRTFQVTMGRFPTPYYGTEILFDRDYHFQGLAESVRIDRQFPEGARRIMPRLQITSVQGYLAQNNLGLPNPTAESQPIYIGAQLRMDFAPFERPTRDADGKIAPEVNSEIEFRITAGIHWFDGEEGISSNLGVGYIEGTTNVLNSDGLIRSEFLIGEVYAELVILRTRRARVKTWFHGLLNFHAAPNRVGSGERNEQAFDAGVSWGMERFDQRWDFSVGFHYFYIEADAVIPEFNSELLNTNIKGYEFNLAVRVLPTLTAFGEISYTERENFNLNGFGKPKDEDSTDSSGRSLRMRIGVYLDF